MTDTDVETLAPSRSTIPLGTKSPKIAGFAACTATASTAKPSFAKTTRGRFEWAIRLITDASGESEREEAGTYASFARAEKKVQTLFAEFMALPSVQDPKAAEEQEQPAKEGE